MTEVNVVTQQEDEQQFADILFLLITVQRFVAFEFISNVRQFFIDPFDFGLLTFALT